MVDQVASVDTGDIFGDDRFYSQVHGIDGRVFSGRTLAVVLSADDEALSHLLGSRGKGRVIAVVAVLAHQRNVGAHAGELGAGGGNIIGGDIVPCL